MHVGNGREPGEEAKLRWQAMPSSPSVRNSAISFLHYSYPVARLALASDVAVDFCSLERRRRGAVPERHREAVAGTAPPWAAASLQQVRRVVRLCETGRNLCQGSGT